MQHTPPLTDTAHCPLVVQVALAVPVADYFDYLYDNHAPARIGVRVKVPFGRRTLVGMVVGISDTSDVPFEKLKPISQTLDTAPLFDEAWLSLARWLSQYYHYPLGECLAVMLPTLIKQGEDPAAFYEAHTRPKTAQKNWQLSADAHCPEFIESALKRSKKQRETFDRFCHILALKNTQTLDGNTLHEWQLSLTDLEKLADKGLLSHTPSHTENFTVDAPLNAPEVHLKETPPTLNPEQKTATDTLKHALDAGTYQGFLLNGVTGSGKTEVYLNTIHHALLASKQVLILVPEIGLTPQTKSRFERRFGFSGVNNSARILTLHSSLSDKQRLLGWHSIKNGIARIVIATRSALFYPFENLGLIIIDECHDSSYKQQDHLRYHACDVALYIGSKSHIPVVLGSATPSLEQLKLSNDGKLTTLTLSERAGNAIAPTYQLIDLRQGMNSHQNLLGDTTTSLLTPRTLSAMKACLEKGEQVLVFLNRRGYAPILLCEACGWQADCVRCSSHMTLHQSRFSHTAPYLACHHCSWQTAKPTHCPDCHSTNLKTLGQGTLQLGEQLHALFSNPQTSLRTYPIVQIDKDTTRKKGDWDAIYTQVLSGEPMILFGTQMLAKGHHFPNVTLVVIVNADSGLLSPNFRAPEHTAQQILQVAGRAGRADKAGSVLIQTHQPENPLLNLLIKDGYPAVAQHLLAERQMLALPPYSHAALITAVAKTHKLAKDAIITIKNTLPNNHPFAVLAPIDAPTVKKNHQYHVQMLILSKHRKPLHDILASHYPTFQTLPAIKGVRLSLDIDPMGW
ncbi:MAG: primosomal protein N' [Moraxella sp.]|nr:primosomal protein N' [Moraxella sp.]